MKAALNRLSRAYGHLESVERVVEDGKDCSFILNEVECTQLSGCFTSEEGASKLIMKYPDSKVIVTLGSKGVIYKSSKFNCYQEAYPVDHVIDTTAAGDTFMGFFIGSILRGNSFSDCIKIGCKAAAIGITRKGAAESIPMLDEVMEKFYE